jgi:hypothetical protein
MNDPRKVDIYSAAHKRNPFPLYTFLRSEAPVFEVRVPVLKRAWLITAGRATASFGPQGARRARECPAAVINEVHWNPATLVTPTSDTSALS